MLWANWLWGLMSGPANAGNWWTESLGEPGGATSAMDLLAFLARAGTPQDGIWGVLDVGALLGEASRLFPPVWSEVWRIVLGGLATTFSIMILLAVITWLMGKAVPRFFPTRKGGDKGADKGSDQKAKAEAGRAAAREVEK
ncbi:MAG: hypothetical protein KJ621_17665 [Proteobacteria bacterium]|nr:hypothetical protein [Pseudomonadota bacterium]